MDVQLVRLQYEILNTSIEVLAESSGLSKASIEFEAKRSSWKQLWPDLPAVSPSEKANNSRQDLEAQLINEGITIDSEIDDVIKTTQKRLQYFSLAKDAYLAAKYARAESSLLDKVYELIEECNTIEAVSCAAKSFKCLVDGTSLAVRAKAIAVGDADGTPLFTMRDMSGVTNAL